MKIIKKLMLNDGEIFDQPPEPLTAEEDIRRLGRGSDRIDIIDTEKQEILGFGGAFTQASGENYMKLSPEEKRRCLDLLFGDDGLRYRFCRVCIGSPDFSSEPYCYIEDGDTDLHSFDIERDRRDVIPFIRDALEYTGGGIFLFASPWTPPAHLKSSGSLTGGRLLREYYPLWADYFVRFIEEYEKEGIRISAVTVQNEPGKHRWESCEWSDGELCDFTKLLAKKLDALPRKVDIYGWDFNRGGMMEHMKRLYAAAGDSVAGAGFHWYNGAHTGELDAHRLAFPGKLLVETEFCHGISARMYRKYRVELIDVLSHWTSAVTEWNLLLDEAGGPYHSRDIGCNSPVYRKGTECIPRGIYREMYMFSHFIDAGSKVLCSSSAFPSVKVLCVRRPDGKLLVYAYNDSVRDEKVTYCLGEARWTAESPAGCLTLYILDN